jgi:trehalose 6-phosphate synthase
MAERPVIIASNRGPVSFARSRDGTLEARRGGGGLVTALTQALHGSGGLWIAAAMSKEDRKASGEGRFEAEVGGESHVLRYLSFGSGQYDAYYNGISNRVLWFLHHALWDLPREPAWGPRTERAWAAYREVNRAFAHALAEEGRGAQPKPSYLVQDYHLSMVPAMLRGLDPEARIAHFCHSPFAGPGYFRTLPATMRSELLRGLLGADVLGFHTDLWAENFLRCCRGERGARVDARARTVRWEGREVAVHVYPISIDPQGLKEQAATDEVGAAERRIERWLGEERLVLRVDRTDLSKNILRGLLAFEALLSRNRSWRGRVRHLALLNPSREGVPEYRKYVRECVDLAGRINRRLGNGRWQPIRMRVKDQFDATLAAYALYDVLLVNPVIDGMNLVAKEGPVLNRKDGVLVLSENAGAFAELGRDALAVNPFDVGMTAQALETALEMSPGERGTRAAGLRDAVVRNRLEDWVGNQLADLDAAAARR